MPFVRIGLIVLCIILFCGIVSAVVPNADFTCTPIATDPLEISCTDQSTGNPTGWAWFFGDEKYDQPWVRTNANTPWEPRYSQTCIAKPDGNLIAIGGSYRNLNPGGIPFGDARGDVWRSKDNGATWTNITISSFGYRMSPTGVLLSDGKTILLIAGYDTNNVMKSVDDGATWTMVNPAPGWYRRHDLTAVAKPDNTIVMMGGQNTSDAANLGDVWRSDDNGVTWSKVTAKAEWTPRSMHTSVVSADGNIILMGGYNQSDIKNDTWRSVDNGNTWTLRNFGSSDYSINWSQRRYLSSVAMPDGSIVLMGGARGVSSKEVWRSKDEGLTWKLVNANPGWTSRSQHCSVVIPNGSIVLIGGYNELTEYTNDVWSLDPASSHDQNPLPHDYAGPGTYQVTLRVYNADGYTTLRKNITVGNVTAAYYYINIMPVPERHVGDKFTINATTNLPAGQEVLVEIRSPCQQYVNTQAGDFSGVSGTVKVQDGKYNPASPCCDQINFLLFDVDSSTFKPDVYTINDTAMRIPRLGMSYFYVREGGTKVTPLDPLIILCGIVGACGIIHCIRKPKR